jgi:hypothetical protein
MSNQEIVPKSNYLLSCQKANVQHLGQQKNKKIDRSVFGSAAT